MSPVIDTELLVSASASGTIGVIAAHLRMIWSEPDVDVVVVAGELLSLIEGGLLSPTVFCVWIGITGDPRLLLIAIRFPHSQKVQVQAIAQLGRMLRRKDTFSPTWSSIGGAKGISTLMLELSANNVKLLCKTLGLVGGVSPTESQTEAITELFCLLESPKTDDHNEDETDARHGIHKYYSSLIAGCTDQKVFESIEIQSDRTLESKYWMSSCYRTVPIPLWRNSVRIFYEQRDMKSWIKNPPPAGFPCLRKYMNNNPDFRLRMLSELASMDSYKCLDVEYIVNRLAIPEIKRAHKRRSDHEAQARIWNLVLQCLERHSGLRQKIPSLLQTLLLVSWTALGHRSFNEAVFQNLVALLAHNHATELDLAKLLRYVAKTQRYQALRMFYQHSVAHNFDIGPASSIISVPKSSKGPLTITLQTILLLPSSEALYLFEGLSRAYPHGRFVATLQGWQENRSVLVNAMSAYPKFQEPEFIRAWLVHQVLKKNAASLSIDIRSIHDDILERLVTFKAEASRARDRTDRARLAYRTLRFCVAIGDLHVYKKTLLWARRFLKDHEAAELTHSSGAIGTLQSETMLSVVSNNHDETALDSRDILREKIKISHEILLFLLENATLSQQEPDFRADNFNPILRLITGVVNTRICEVGKFQSLHKLSDEEIFDVLWQPTLEMLLKVESILINPANARLNALDICQRMDQIQRANISKHMYPATARFLDTYAKSLDALWAERRARRNPSVMTLNAPWPRGLPVHWLFRIHSLKCRALSMPFIQTRAMAVVFCSPESTLVPVPEDNEIRGAIQNFVENWRLSLKIHLTAASNETERQEMIMSAWIHVTQNLAGDRFTAKQSILFWGDVFQYVLEQSEYLRLGIVESEFQQENRAASRLSSLPKQVELHDIIEWNPDPEYVEKLTISLCKNTNARTLDCLMQAGRTERISKFEVPRRPEMQRLHAPLTFWGLPKDDHKELYIIAAMLYLNDMYGSNTSFLSSAFPNQHYPRIPACYLHQDFLERQGPLAFELALSCLEVLKEHVPVLLLHRLAQSLYSSLKADNVSSSEAYKVTIAIIAMLAKSDRPILAAPLIMDFISSFSSQSAWHRRLFNAAFLSTLGSEDLRVFFRTFADNILSRLQQQKEEVLSDVSISQRQEPLVKVTTIKMLAQTLLASDSVDSKMAVGVLTTLITQSTNIDVKAAAINSLINFAQDSSNLEMKNEVLHIITTYVVPTAASLSETQPNVDWVAAEAGGPLPEIHSEASARPLLDILQHIDNRYWGQDNCAAVTELMPTVLRLSVQNNKRWIKLFLKRNGFSLERQDDLPGVPVDLSAMRDYAYSSACSEEFRTQFLELLAQYIIINLDPPMELKAITESVKGDAKLLNSHAGKHWLSLWDQSTTQAMDYMAGILASGTKHPSAAHDAVLERTIMAIVEVALKKSDTELLDKVMNRAGLGAKTESMIQHVTSRVEAIRTPEWQANPTRQPRFLPDMLRLRIKVFTSDNGKDVSAVEIIDWLALAVASDRPSYIYLQFIKDQLKSLQNKRIELAIEIGSLQMFPQPDNLGEVEYLRIDIAEFLLRGVKSVKTYVPQNKNTLADAAAMLRVWRNSEIEYLREKAHSMPNSFE